jgi:hypothetical protein
MMRHDSMINDFFCVYDAINHIVPSLFKDLEFWDTDLTKLLVQTATATHSYDYAQVSTMLDEPELKIKHFLVVHCALSNHLNEIIGEKDYKVWDVKNGQLVVTLNDNTSQMYQAADIYKLMTKSEYVDLSYDSLVNDENQIHHG